MLYVILYTVDKIRHARPRGMVFAHLAGFLFLLLFLTLPTLSKIIGMKHNGNRRKKKTQTRMKTRASHRAVQPYIIVV